MSELETQKRNGSPGWLIFMGALWLLLAIGLLYYQLVQPASIKVEWNTATELRTAGFYLCRSHSPDGAFVRVNERLVPSEGDALSGASYTYTDKDVIPGETYFYVLEEIEYDATANRYDEDMFSYTVPRVTWWAIVLTAVSVLTGLSLLVMGLRESRN